MNDRIQNRMRPWQFFANSAKLLGMGYLTKHFHKNAGYLSKWCADPKWNQDARPNPLDKIRDMGIELDDIGRTDVALIAINALAESIGFEAQPLNEPTPDRDDIRDEILDDFPVLTEFHQSIRDKKPVAEVRVLLRKLKRELDENVVLYEETLKR